MDGKKGGVLSIEALAAYLKIPKSTIYKLVREDKIPIPEGRPELAITKMGH